MKNICFLITAIDRCKPYNFYYLANALIKRGHNVSLCLMDTISVYQCFTIGKMQALHDPLELGAPIELSDFSYHRLDPFDVVWILGKGNRHTFLDKIEILRELSRKTRVINSIESLLFLHGKYPSGALSDLMNYPETYASSDVNFLWHIFSQKKGTWVVKPPAESFGKDVFLLKPDDTNARVILENMTGNGQVEKYCVMQRFIPEITEGEKRVLIASGQVAGQYRRLAGNDHRTNLHQGAAAEPCELTGKERELCRRLGDYFLESGALFVGVDMVYPYVIELNVMNPGGIGTLIGLGEEHMADRVVELIVVK